MLSVVLFVKDFKTMNMPTNRMVSDAVMIEVLLVQASALTMLTKQSARKLAQTRKCTVIRCPVRTDSDDRGPEKREVSTEIFRPT